MASSKRTSSDDQWDAAEKASRAEAAFAKTGGVSLDPAKAKEIVTWPPDADKPVFAIEQKSRPPLVITQPVVPCECGRKLVPSTITSELLLEGFSAGVKYRGLCFLCGWQEAIYAICHYEVSDEQIEAVEDVIALRRSA